MSDLFTSARTRHVSFECSHHSVLSKHGYIITYLHGRSTDTLTPLHPEHARASALADSTVGQTVFKLIFPGHDVYDVRYRLTTFKRNEPDT